MTREVQVFDSRNTDSQQLPDVGAHVTIERNQPLPAGDVYDGLVRAVIVRGFDTDGRLVDERGLLERRGLGKLQQFVTEKWKVARVKRAVAKTACVDTAPSV